MKKPSSRVNQATLSFGDEHMGKFLKSRWPIRMGIAFALVSLSACKTTAEMEPVQPSAYTIRHPIVVTGDEVRLRVQSGRNNRGLTSAQRARIDAFITNYRDSGTGSLKIKTPSSALNDVSSARVVADIRRIIERNAVPRSSIRMVNYYPRKSRRSSAVILSYRHYSASTNECGAWPESNTITKNNQPSWSFGCATQNNLAAMIANPRDLIVPRNSSPADAQRRDTVIGKYRAGKDTTAAVSSQANGSVSSVAK
jgi:pilus assembly protein CpaD